MIRFLTFALVTCCLFVGCASTQLRVQAVDPVANERLLELRNQVALGAIPVSRLLEVVPAGKIFEIGNDDRDMELLATMNAAYAPGVSHSLLERREVVILAVPFGVGPAPFVSRVTYFQVFVRDRLVIAIGFSTESEKRFRSRIRPWSAAKTPNEGVE